MIQLQAGLIKLRQRDIPLHHSVARFALQAYAAKSPTKKQAEQRS